MQPRRFAGRRVGTRTPYLYVGPWGDERPGTTDTGTRRSAPCCGYADIVDNEAPLTAATAFFDDGIHRLREHEWT